MTDFFLRYETDDSGDWHQWAAIKRDKSFAVHIWCRRAVGIVEGDLYGGVESHTAATGDQVDHETCPFLNGPCRHDGSSLYFEESFKWRAKEAIRTGDHASMLRAAKGVLMERMEREVAE
jgi:hypothetical protein